MQASADTCRRNSCADGLQLQVRRDGRNGGNVDGKMKRVVLLVPEKRVCTRFATAPRSNRQCRQLTLIDVKTGIAECRARCSALAYDEGE